MLVGIAAQAGALPVSIAAIERAIRLNGAAVEMNLAAFAWGRWLMQDRAMVDATAVLPAPPPAEEGYDATVARLTAHLTGYQSPRWAKRFRATLAQVEAAEEAFAPGRRSLSRIAAVSLGKVMSYKDEYEVARLHMDTAFRDQLARDFAGDAKVVYHLAPPLMSKLDSVTGHPRKRAFGAWVEKGFAALKTMKALRGTALDPFGRSEERRAERALIADLEGACALAARTLGAQTEADIAALLALPQDVKGFGHVKARNLAAMQPKWDGLISNLSARG
jgi:indolepyruvate ferredoxin oxidoreductase